MTAGSPSRVLYLTPDTDHTGASQYLAEEYPDVTIIHEHLVEHADHNRVTDDIDCIVLEVPQSHEQPTINLSEIPSSEIPLIVYVEETRISPNLSSITNSHATIVPYTDTSSFDQLKHTIQQTLHTTPLANENPWELLETIIDAAITLDSNHRVTNLYSTESSLFDSDVDTLKHERLWEAIPPLCDSPLANAYTDAIKNHNTQVVEAEFTPTETWYRYHIHPTQKTTAILIEDITDRKDHETTLKNSNTHLQTAIEAGAIGTWLWKIPEDKLIAGPQLAKTFGVDPDNARNGLPLDVFTDSIHDDDLNPVMHSINTAIENCEDYETEYRVYDADGDLRWVVARGHVECDESGNPQTFPGILTDITAQKRYELRLEQQNERLEEFASVVSHDLRNPLQIVGGHLDLIKDDVPPDKYETITRALNRMDDLITGLLSIARTNNTPISTEQLELNPLLQRSWKNIDQSTATLTSTINHEINADEIRLQQLFENLFRNAIDHSRGDVAITVGELDDGFYVEDDGPGIPEEHRDKVLDIGYSTDPDGTGVGLKIVEQVIHDHDWTLTITESHNGGARFEITDITIVE